MIPPGLLPPIIAAALILGAAMAWPIAYYAGQRRIPVATARDQAEIARIGDQLLRPVGYLHDAQPDESTGWGVPVHEPARVGPGQHRRKRWTLRAWWASLPVRDVDAPVRAELGRQSTPDAYALAVQAGVLRATGAPRTLTAVDVWAREWRRRMRPDWHAMVSPLPVPELLGQPRERVAA